MMDSKVLGIIEELMEELQGDMKYSHEDLDERLGRKKPGVEVVKIEGKMPPEEMMMGEESPMLEKAEEVVGMDLDGDDEMDEEHEEEVMPSRSSRLRERVAKLRGY